MGSFIISLLFRGKRNKYTAKTEVFTFNPKNYTVTKLEVGGHGPEDTLGFIYLLQDEVHYFEDEDGISFDVLIHASWAICYTHILEQLEQCLSSIS